MATSAAASVNTTKVQDRRQLRFSSLDEILADAERLAAGPTRCLGNWTCGQIMDHLSRVMKASIDGSNFRAPLPIRILARLMKNRWLSKPMPAGFKLPRRAAEILPGEPISTEQGLANLRAMIERLKREPQRAASAVFGPMTDEEWVRLHCRHAELHLSFIVPG